jgi:thermitase
MKELNLAIRLLSAAVLVLLLVIINRDSGLNNISSNLNKSISETNNTTASDKLFTSLARNSSNLAYFRTNYPDQLTVNDPYYYKQWALNQMGAQELWQATTEESKVIVAILDTGIDRNHEDLKEKVIAEINFTESPTTDDIYGHGTHVAGIIAGTRNNGIGIAGLASDSRLMNVKVADDQGKVQAAAVTKGVMWAVDNGANVINISLTIKASSPDLEKAVNYAWGRGVVVVAASSNENDELICYPAAYKNSISVASSYENDTSATLPNQLKNADVVAPGFNIYSTLPSNSYGYKSGTSFATAHISGLSALLFHMVTDKNGDGFINDDIRTAIQSG